MKSKSKNTWLQLTSVGIQIGVVMYLAAWAGRWCDEHYQTESSWFTLGFYDCRNAHFYIFFVRIS